MKQLGSVVGAFVLTVVGLLALTTVPSSADDQGALAARINQTVSKDYPALIGSYPPSPDPNVPDPDPANCTNLPSCGVVHLTVEQPDNLSIFDEFAIEVVVKWDNSAPVDNDLDLYLWYDPQGANSIERSRTKSEPEQIRLGEPTSASYLLVIANVSGANRGYTVSVKEIYARGERPSELDAPTATTVGSSSSDGRTAPPRATATTSKPASPS